MDCVNHIGVSATAFCQTCGKALCANCVRNAPGGQVQCEPCSTAWQSFQQPFQVPAGGPNPAAAAVLGLIPGVGAMYNGQFFKGLIHVVIFAVLISITTHYGIFGIFIGAWVLYQSFEAFHTAKARRDGQNETIVTMANMAPHPSGAAGAFALDSSQANSASFRRTPRPGSDRDNPGVFPCPTSIGILRPRDPAIARTRSRSMRVCAPI